jgi:hypothetical protein
MANKILAPILEWFGYSLFTPSKLQKRIQSTSQFDDAGARATSKKCCNSETSEEKKTIQRGYNAHKWPP